MKKVMIALAAVALAGAAQATATFSFTGFDTKYSGYSFYVFYSQIQSNESVDELAAFAFNNQFLSEEFRNDRGFSTWKDWYAANAEGLTLANISAQGSGSWQIAQYSEVDVSMAWTASVLAFNGGIAPGNEYVLFETACYFGAETRNPTFNMSGVGELQTGTLMSDAVPEPTSGLLMLIGMAGLALRRKRA